MQRSSPVARGFVSLIRGPAFTGPALMRSITYSPAFVKQVSKGKRATAVALSPSTTSSLPGKALAPDDPMMGGFLLKFGELRGWHTRDVMGINVAHGAKIFRGPEPRVRFADFPFGTSFAWHELLSGELQWRLLEKDAPYTMEPNQHGLLEQQAPVLVTCFTKLGS